MHTDTFSATLRERYKARQQQKQSAGSKRIATAVATATEATRPRKQKAVSKPSLRPQQRRRTTVYVKKERICQSCDEPFNPTAQAKYCGKEECQAAKVEEWRINKKATDAARYRRTRKVEYEPRVCKGCEEEFVPKRVDQSWCSAHACQNRRRNEAKKASKAA